MTAHAKLSASGAHRWMACPGSVNAESGLSDKSSSFAEEGTQAHEVAEKALKGGWNADTIWNRKDLAEHLQTYIDFVRSIPHDFRVIEQRVNFSDWVPDGFGTADAICIKDDLIHIIDLKFGQGVPVYAEQNPQAMLYALGAYSEFEFMFDLKRVKISIVQPRIDNISEWEIDIPSLLKWGQSAANAALATQDPAAQRIPGEKQCRWCKAKATCPALYDMTAAIIGQDFEQLDEPALISSLTDAQMRKALEARPLIESWLAALETVVRGRIVDGAGFDGFKIVEGRSVRRWGNEQEAVATLVNLLGDEAYTKKLISPAQAEKTLGKKKKVAIEGLIIKPRGAPTLATDNDPRPSIIVSEADFVLLTISTDASILDLHHQKMVFNQNQKDKYNGKDQA